MNAIARIVLGPMMMSAALCLAAMSQANAELDVAKLKTSIETSVEADYPKLEALYKDIHAHPEVAFQEVKTAAKLATEMRALGFEVTEKVGKTGLVAIYRNGEGPTILVRTELDALPMEEKTGLPYASRDKTDWNGQETFVDHSCGHDIHMASWVGTAKTLVGLKDRWHGTLMFIAQPAEETVSGAKAMIADGLFTRFKKPDFGFALHDGPFAYGTIDLSHRRRIVEFGQPRSDIPWPGRSRRGTAADHRSRADRGALHRGRAKRDQPREGSRPNSVSSASARSTPARPTTSFPIRWCCAGPSAPSSRKFAPGCWRGSSGRRKRRPRCRALRSLRSSSPKAPRPS